MTPLHFISYPKSGRTWVRYMLRLAEADERIHFHHDGFEFNDGKCPPHDYSVEHRVSRYTGMRVVFLTRNPHDVLVSLYYQVTGRFSDIFDYSGNLSSFVRDPYFGIEPLARFLHTWHDVAPRVGALVVSYEQLHENAEDVMRKILDYYEIAITPSGLKSIVTRGNAKSMKIEEDSGRFSEPWLRRRNNFSKVRAAIVGSHELEMEASDIQHINSILSKYSHI